MIHQENRYFDVYPRVVRAGHTTTITIRPLFDYGFDMRGGTAGYRLTIYPVSGQVGQMTWSEVEHPALRHAGDTFQVHYSFESEQEYVLHVEVVSTDQKVTQVGEFRVYALEEDLFERRPFKGDLHLHSRRSDGEESPAYVAGACRRIGLDFMAVTDHRRYAPSLEAIQAFEDVETDLRIFPGEEIHPPENPVHIINFGGRFSISELFTNDPMSYYSGVKALTESLAFSPDMDSYPFASCVWCFNKIREAGGLGLLCHPYWFIHHRFDVPESLVSLLFEHQPYDALEVVGGYHRYELESNTLQVARYHEEQAHGKRIPVVGVSDAHGCEVDELFGWYYTLVFAPSLELEDLVQSVKNLYSVAVEALPGTAPRAHGPFRLVKYAQFLLREIMPQHDELCIEEGRLMLAHIAGDERAAMVLQAYQGRTQAFYDHIWEK